MSTPLRPTILALGLLAPAAATAQVELRVLADPPGHDDLDLNGEYVLVSNEETTPLNLSRWRLCNAVYHCYVFPEGATLGPGGALRVRTGTGRDSLETLYMRRDRPLWANWADVATLTDETGAVRARCMWDRGRGIDCSPP